jgi:hypothetical protein
MVDEGASICIMYIYCWKALVSPNLNMSVTLFKSFDGHMFHPNGILIALPIELGGKTIFVNVEVVHAPLEYNMLLECTWVYEMIVVVSSVFRVLSFPHQGKIIVIDQLVFCTPDLGSNAGSNVPFIGDTTHSYMNVSVGMFKYPSLMGISPLSPTSLTTNITPIDMISSFTSASLSSFYHWVVPHPEDVDSYGASMPLTVVEIVDPKIPTKSADTGHQIHPHMECDQPTTPVRVIDSLNSLDSLDF